jgi:poly(rC)-binding protein 2/3/4
VIPCASQFKKRGKKQEIKMSSSPPHQTSTKRPLEEASSPSRATDQPEAKRPALDKVIKNDEETEASESTLDIADKNGDDDGTKSDQPDGPATDTASDTKAADTSNAAAMSDAAVHSAAAHDETAWIHIRAVISSPEAATIIGKGGENVSNIRKMSNAKCTVSDYQKGAVERILTVSGIVDAVAKVSFASSDMLYALLLLGCQTDLDPGIWFDYSYAEQRATWRSFHCFIQDVPPATPDPSYSYRLHHW